MKIKPLYRFRSAGSITRECQSYEISIDSVTLT